jgi:apolipoprotein D and lipocalin family protein
MDRYLGDWYVIANIPYILENGKVATLDRYAKRPDGRMDNIFIFRKGSFDAPEQEWRGVSWVHNRTTNAEWRVQFIWPFRVPYLVIDLDPDYRWAVIGHPSRNYFWILARTRRLPDDVYTGILARAAEQGYDVSRVAKVPQPSE